MATNFSNDLVPVEYYNQRVLTTAQLAEFYECKEIQIQQNFANNKERFVEGKHFFKLEGDTLKDFKASLGDSKISSTLKFTSILLLWTKRGTARHAKMLGTDKAWDVFETLEESYFASKPSAPLSEDELISRALVLATSKLARIEEQNKLLTARVEFQGREIEAKDNRIAEQETQINEMRPKANYYNIILDCPDVVPISVISKDYGMSAQHMNNLLHDLGIQFKQGNIWLLYQEYANEGYTQTKTYHMTDKNGVEHAKTHTYWTQKGRFFLYEFLGRHGILPTIERVTNV